MMSGQLHRALATFDEALRADPQQLEARFNRGIVLLRLERHGQAAASFGKLVESEDGRLRAAAAYHGAIAHDRAGDSGTAEAWLQNALAAEPELDSALLYLGIVREKQQKFAPAGEAYREYLKRHPDSIVAMLRFGMSAYRAGYRDTARKYLQQVVDLAPTSLEAAEARKFLVMWD